MLTVAISITRKKWKLIAQGLFISSSLLLWEEYRFPQNCYLWPITKKNFHLKLWKIKRGFFFYFLVLVPLRIIWENRVTNTLCNDFNINILWESNLHPTAKVIRPQDHYFNSNFCFKIAYLSTRTSFNIYRNQFEFSQRLLNTQDSYPKNPNYINSHKDFHLFLFFKLAC